MRVRFPPSAFFSGREPTGSREPPFGRRPSPGAQRAAGGQPAATVSERRAFLDWCPAFDKQIINDEVEGWEYVDRAATRGQRAYLLRVKGDSMNRAGMDDGDRVIVLADQPPENGQVVVALVDGECCIKRLSRDAQQIILSPDSTNPKHQPRTYTKKNEVLLRGVVKWVWRKTVR